MEDTFLNVESGLEDAPSSAALGESTAHKLWPGRNLFFGGAHTVATDGGGFSAAGDPRRGGESRIV